MKRPCRKIKKLLPDFADGLLNDRDRQKVEKHLAGCAACDSDLKIQLSWLARRDMFKSATGPAILPEGLNERIMLAIRAEQPTQVANRPRASFYRRMMSAPGLAGLAAAVLILLVAWQVVPHLMLGGRVFLPEQHTLSGNDQASGSETSGAEIYGSGTVATSLAGAPVWRVDTGTTATKDAITDLSTTDRDCFSQYAGEQSDAYAAFLAQAQAVHIAYQDYPIQRTLILASFDQNTIEKQLDLAKNAFSTCETPLQIEIIRTDELADKLNTLDPALFGQLFPASAPSSTWIFILIGA